MTDICDMNCDIKTPFYNKDGTESWLVDSLLQRVIPAKYSLRNTVIY